MLDLQNNVSTTTNNNGGEAVKLLELSSSDSLDSPSFTNFQASKPKRKVRFKKVFRSGSKSKSSSSRPNKFCQCHLADTAKLLGCFLLLALVCALVWYVITLSTKIQELQDKFHDIEAGNRNTPEALHVIHSKLKELDFNVSTLFLEISKNLIDIVNCTTEIKHLKETTKKLQESIAAAPEIQDLPKGLNALSESVANFGSKMNALDSAVKELKDSQSTFQTSTQNLHGELESLKSTVQELSNASKLNSSELMKSQSSPLVRDLTFQSAIQETNQLVSYLQKELLNLVRSVDKMNTSLSALNDLATKVDTNNDAIVWIVNDTHSQNARMYALENYVNTNLTLRVEHLENDGTKSIEKPHLNAEMPISAIQELINQTITEAILRIANPDVNPALLHKSSGNYSSEIIPRTHNVLLLLAGLLKQVNHIPASSLLNEENATEIITYLLNNTFHELMAEHDFKIQDIETKINKTMIEHQHLISSKNNNQNMEKVFTSDSSPPTHDSTTNQPSLTSSKSISTQ